MNSRTIFKIKDSVDLFLSNEKYIIVYFMNSRQRKSFRVNDDMLRLFELIDGEKDVQTLQSIMHDDFEIDPECTSSILTALLRSKIITEVVKEQNILPDNLVRRYSRQINYFSEFLEGEIGGYQGSKEAYGHPYSCLWLWGYWREYSHGTCYGRYRPYFAL